MAAGSACAAIAAIFLGQCVYVPTPTGIIHIVDSVVDVRGCRNLGRLASHVATSPGFDASLDSMKVETAAKGGNTLLLARSSRDWSYVRAGAYDCRYLEPWNNRPARTILRVKG